MTKATIEQQVLHKTNAKHNRRKTMTGFQFEFLLVECISLHNSTMSVLENVLTIPANFTWRVPS